MRYLLDTNICIYLIKRHPPEVVRRLAGLHVGDVAMSVITYAELRAGVERNRETREKDAAALQSLIGKIPVLPFDDLAAESYGVLRAALADRRRDALDRLIAAHALSLHLVLVTDNERDFAGYPDLQVENWVAAADD